VGSLALFRRLDVEVDHANAALLEHVDPLCDRSPGILQRSHGTNPDRAVCFFFCTDGSANVWNYTSTKVDSDGAEGRTATDQAQAKKLYDDAQKQIIDDAPNLFLANQNQFLAYSPKLQNFTVMPDESWQGLITASVQ